MIKATFLMIQATEPIDTSAEEKVELADGDIVEMLPARENSGRASLPVATSLLAYEKRTGSGRAFPDGVGLRVNLPHREAFSADVGLLTRIISCSAATASGTIV